MNSQETNKPSVKLSVALITYNHEGFIAQAIESILAQRVNFEYEIIIGEDCSTDGTRAVVVDYHRRYPDRIALLLREQRVGAMRNYLETISSCRGEYVAFLEGDDYWTTNDKLQKQVDFLDSHPDRAICCGRVRALFEAGTEFDRGRGMLDVHPPNAAGAYALEDLLKVNFVMTCTTVLRRKLVPAFPKWFFKMKLGDWPLYAMVARYGKIELMDEITGAYRIHRGGTWTSMQSITRANESARMLRALDRELGYQYKTIIRETITAPYLNLARTSWSQGRHIDTAKRLFSYIRNGGLRRSNLARRIVGIIMSLLFGSKYKMFS